MKIYCLWFVTALALVLTKGKVEIGFPCAYSSGQSGKCQEFIRCSSAQHTYYFNNGENKPPDCDGQLYCCIDFEEPSSHPRHFTVPKIITSTETFQEHWEPGYISTKICQEYIKSTHTKNQCLINNEYLFRQVDNAELNEFPHIAQLGYEVEWNVLKFNCTASLISRNFLLTSAHCINLKNPPVAVRFGNPDSPIHRNKYAIEEIYLHPRYERKYSAYHDIALVKLRTNIDNNAEIRPACLMTKSYTPNSEAVFAGYRKNYRSKLDELMKTPLTLLNDTSCMETFPEKDFRLHKGLDEDKMICAQGATVYSTFCPTYYGNPVQTFDKDNCTYYIIGVQSFGNDCGYGPGIYTKVSEYILWIESVVWPDK